MPMCAVKTNSPKPQYFQVVNWNKHQHYKDRNPPWIKLHSALLEHYEFSCLQDASKLHLILIWLLASRTKNRMVYDGRWVQRKIDVSKPVDLDSLLDLGFIELIDDASNPLATRSQNASAETETETETETEGKSLSFDNDELMFAMSLYNEVASRCGLPKAMSLSDARKGKLRQRLKECGGIDGWKDALGKVERSPHCRGDNNRGWTASFDFLLQAESFARLMEGKYDDRKNLAKRNKYADAVRRIEQE